ncbi:putative Ig domain-containing protein, partial [uncultured Nitratireductor sp.]|uniref:PKD domain-containing protein n=1 Tax=uncultured Nitratireductor sp. TaxID=520953 RepID=UPI0025E6774E
MSSGGNYWINGTIAFWPGGDITQDDVESECGISDISNFTSDGANGTFDTDDFMGIRFRGTSDTDGNVYEYVLGLSGSSQTRIVNSRSQVSIPNNPPIANAGPDQHVMSGALVTLDGTASDANDPEQSLTYAWTQTTGPTVALSDSASASPSFTTPVLPAGTLEMTLTFELLVNDGFEDSVADTVSITVTREPPDITLGPDSLPDGKRGEAYGPATLTASGGIAPHSFAVTAGGLPDGLSLTADGTLSGTPTEAGNFTFTVTASDADSFTGMREYTLTLTELILPEAQNHTLSVL